ncbi:MAG: DUF3035 domain-containing protein [Pseudomonadota bacterium]
MRFVTALPVLPALGLALAITAVTGCAGGRDSGINEGRQDEFLVVTKPPLTVPPEYSLRPPGAGQALPLEVDPARSGSVTAFGETLGQNASGSERALVAAAGANAVDPLIRSTVDWEEASTVRKSPSLGDRILFWRDNEETQAIVAADNATGGAEIIIADPRESRTKLPGT